VHLTKLINPAALATAIEDGLVRRQVDPTGTLAILNYTEAAVYGRQWNDVTEQCRGLIYNVTTGEVVARPYRKFFNYGEYKPYQAPTNRWQAFKATHAAKAWMRPLVRLRPARMVERHPLDLSARAEVTDKADGSLAVRFMAADGRPAIATRGSFTSDQAVHATAVYRDRYEGKWNPRGGVTYLLEIVYPANRIVLDYGDTDDLILLGGVDIETGQAISPIDIVNHHGWPGPVIRVLDVHTLGGALALPPRPNAEGVVVRYLDGPQAGTMVKLKQADYVYLHRIVTGLTSRRIWERLAIWHAMRQEPKPTVREMAQVLHMDPADVQGVLDAGPDWRTTIEQTAPEEFTEWIWRTIADLQRQDGQIALDVEMKVCGLQGMDRKVVAAAIAKHPHRGMIFRELDGKSTVLQRWAAIRPEAEKPFAARGEDVA